MKLSKLLVTSLMFFALVSCQKTVDPFMTLETKTISVADEGGTAIITLSANVSYSVVNDCHDGNDQYWARIVDTQTQGEETTFTFEVDPNPRTEVRAGTVRFIGEKVTPLKLTILQDRLIPKGIDPLEATVGHNEITATFNVFGDADWTASCADADVTINPTSGSGEGIITVTFPENDNLTDRTIKVNVSLQGDKTYTYTLTQKRYLGIIADWDINALKAETSATFCDTGDQTEFPGTNGKYLNASTGSGKLEFWATERTGYPSVGGYVCRRAVGGNGDPYVRGVIPGDCWYVYANHKNQTIPAGSEIHIYFVTKFGTGISGYWMLEYKDGDTWKPVFETQTRNESATEGISGNTLATPYSAEITYNFAGLLLDSKNNGAYIAVDGNFVTSVDMNEVAIRFAPAGRLGLDGSRYSGLYIDQTFISGETRFSAQRPSTEDGAAVRIYDQHLTIEFVE